MTGWAGNQLFVFHYLYKTFLFKTWESDGSKMLHAAVVFNKLTGIHHVWMTFSSVFRQKYIVLLFCQYPNLKPPHGSIKEIWTQPRRRGHVHWYYFWTFTLILNEVLLLVIEYFYIKVTVLLLTLWRSWELLPPRRCGFGCSVCIYLWVKQLWWISSIVHLLYLLTFQVLLLYVYSYKEVVLNPEYVVSFHTKQIVLELSHK